MVGVMSYSKARTPSLNLKKIYNKWRLTALGLDLAGLITFFFALGIEGYTLPLMAVSVVLLWAGVAVSYRYLQIEMGKPFETVARVSYVISMALALVISVLTAITALNG
jgi:uncharacterized membrane protein YjjP (DUF1212 family)